MKSRLKLIQETLSIMLSESNDDTNTERQFEQGRISGVQAFGTPNKIKPSSGRKKPLTKEEKQEIARQRKAAIQASIDAENHSRAINAGFPNWDAYMDSYRNDPRMAKFKQTNEETLYELYGLAGLYGRFTGQRRELTPEEQARGDNPFLNPDGTTVYHTSPLAKALGGALYVKLASRSVVNMSQRAKSLASTTREMIKSIISGKVKGTKGEPLTPDQAVSIVKPRSDEVTKLVGTPEKPGKIGRRTKRIGEVTQVVHDILARLPQPKPKKPPEEQKPPEEPPHYYG